MAAVAFLKPFGQCPSHLKISSPHAHGVKVASSPFAFHSKVYLWRSRSSFSWKGQENAMQWKRKMSFSVRASVEGEGEEKKKLFQTLPSELQELINRRPSTKELLIVVTGIAILLYTWKAIAYELLYWLGLVLRVFRPVVSLVFSCLETAADVLFSLVDAAIPLPAVVVTGTAWAFLFVKEVYAFIVDMTPVQALIEALVLATVVLGIGEATRRDAISSQPDTIGMAGLFGLGAVLGFFPPPIFVVFLFVLVAFSSLVMKRDAVSSVMPVAAVLAAVAEPWVRGVALVSFLALAIYQNWKSPEKEQAAAESRTSYQGLPTLMYVLSFMVGISTTARWLYFRHLLWFSK